MNLNFISLDGGNPSFCSSFPSCVRDIAFSQRIVDNRANRNRNRCPTTKLSKSCTDGLKIIVSFVCFVGLFRYYHRARRRPCPSAVRENRRSIFIKIRKKFAPSSYELGRAQTSVEFCFFTIIANRANKIVRYEVINWKVISTRVNRDRESCMCPRWFSSPVSCL